ncbi:MAG TPA: alpha/beta fold hydrolase [Thermoanaerobaculia bacterium]|jgi:pimeloyl-ACP methyl ester carboxylesterase|nr:alpha/beta fold hydrolase [Thermoanaerobaculia bacterium]
MRKIPLVFVLSFFQVTMLVGKPAPRSDLAGKLKPCHVPDVEEEVFCGRYEVYENRAARNGRKIGLNIVVLPAQTPNLAPDALVFLAGGGVVPATRYARFLSRAYPELRRQRDVLLIDQRGSGGSNGLECDLPTDPLNAEYRDEARFLDAVRRCRKELEQKADLRYYTTPIAMDDLDEVRGWLGYSRLNLFGVSYGTKAAMVYLRQHPERVRTVALQGVVPLDAPMWLEIPRSSQQALDQAFVACGRQPGCHEAFPKLAQEFNALLQRLAEKPARVKVTKIGTRQEVEVSIDAEILRGFVGSVLFSASRIHDLPLLIHLAQEGDYQPLAGRVAFRGEGEIPKGVYLSIVCSEQVPQFDPGALPAAAAGTFMGAFRLGREISACREWARGWLPEGFWKPVESKVPALVLTGALDHATPPRYGEHVAQTLVNSRHLVLPNRGHNDTDPCINGMIQAFMIAGSLEGLDTSCLAKTEDLTFALRREELIN